MRILVVMELGACCTTRSNSRLVEGKRKSWKKRECRAAVIIKKDCPRPSQFSYMSQKSRNNIMRNPKANAKACRTFEMPERQP